MRHGYEGLRTFGRSALAMFLFGIFLLAMPASIFAAEPEGTPLYNIPSLDGIVIDGQADDWGENGFKVEAMADLQGTENSVADLDGRFRVAWDARGLLLLVTVKDDVIEENDVVEHLYLKDSVEVFLADKQGGKEMVQVILAPGGDGKHESARCHVYDRRADPELKKVAYAPLYASAVSEGGYVLEVLMPWEGLVVKPEQGTELGFQIYVDDYDGPGRSIGSIIWYPESGTHLNSQNMHRIRLADKPSEPACAVGWVQVKGYKYILAKAIGDSSIAGSELQVEASGKTLGTAKFERQGERVVASAKFAIPPEGTVWPCVDMKVDGKLIERLAAPDLAAARETAMRILALAFESYCFRGDTLPSGRLPDPVEAQNLLGEHKMQVTFYDSKYQEVTSAAEPGRYGAYTMITPEKGDVLHRFVTLFRLPDEDGWELPAQNTPEEAREFAHRFETAPDEKVTTRNSPWSKEQLWLHGLKKKLGLFEPYRYHVHEPEGASKKDGKLHPAIIFLHGGAGLRRSFEEVKDLIPMDYERDDFPFYLFTPHSGGQRWQRTHLDELLDELLERYPIDPDRIYLTGLSMGGMGTWMYAAARPDRFAAAVTVCGGGDPDEAEYLKDLPIWNFHGDADTTVPIDNSESMVSALAKVDGRVRYSIYLGVGHNVYEYSYADPELFPWMLKQVRGKPAESRGVKVFRIDPVKEEEGKKEGASLGHKEAMAEARMSEGVGGVGTIRSAIRVYTAVNGHSPVFPVGTCGASLGKINVEPSDLEGRNFGAMDYTVVSNAKGYRVTATNPESGLKFEINQDGEETSGKGYVTTGQ